MKSEDQSSTSHVMYSYSTVMYTAHDCSYITTFTCSQRDRQFCQALLLSLLLVLERKPVAGFVAGILFFRSEKAVDSLSCDTEVLS